LPIIAVLFQSARDSGSTTIAKAFRSPLIDEDITTLFGLPVTLLSFVVVTDSG